MMKQSHVKRKLTAAILILFLTGPTILWADGGRDPFTKSEKRLNTYNYARAMGLVLVKGIVRTEHFHGCLAQIGTMDCLTVLKTGNKISLDNDGLAHMFRVLEIREKSVVFISKQGKTYEVFIR